jgi:acyl-coenzyme A synthetase/AMP-(fatty) acid ligase
MHYSYGLSVINSHLAVGATLLLTDRSLFTKAFWDFLAACKATSLSGVPYTYEMLKKLRFLGKGGWPLRTLTQAGGKLRIELVEELAGYCAAHGMRFYVMYGQTEATARMAYLPSDLVFDHPSSIGIPIPGGDFTLVDEAGDPITSPDREGEIVYRGPNVMLGYAEGPQDLTKGDCLGGVLHTGDQATFDAEGLFYITGRKKRFIKLHGNRMNLDDIERHLNENGIPCICGGSDERILIGCSRAGDEKRAAEVVGATFKVHHSVIEPVLIKKVIKNASGKILYSRTFEQVQE